MILTREKTELTMTTETQDRNEWNLTHKKKIRRHPKHRFMPDLLHTNTKLQNDPGHRHGSLFRGMDLFSTSVIG